MSVRLAAVLALAVVPAAAGAYDGGSVSGGHAREAGPGYPLSLPQTLRGTVTVPLPEAPARPADTLGALDPVLAACWQPPRALAQAEGVEVTARLSLPRAGSPVGPPRITYAAGAGPESRGLLVRATLDGLARCLPARITPGLGRAIAGRPVALDLVYRPPA